MKDFTLLFWTPPAAERGLLLQVNPLFCRAPIEFFFPVRVLLFFTPGLAWRFSLFFATSMQGGISPSPSVKGEERNFPILGSFFQVDLKGSLFSPFEAPQKKPSFPPAVAQDGRQSLSFLFFRPMVPSLFQRSRGLSSSTGEPEGVPFSLSFSPRGFPSPPPDPTSFFSQYV